MVFSGPSIRVEYFWWRLNDQNDSVLIAVNGDGRLFVGRPIRRVTGPAPELSVKPAASMPVSTREAALDEIQRIIRNRRRSFRSCHFCGEKTAPEMGERQDLGDGHPARFVCHGFMSKELGVVF
jgi:hypothetical protein